MSRALLAALALALFPTVPSAIAALPSTLVSQAAPPRVYTRTAPRLEVMVDPPLPDAPLGWRRSPTRVLVVATGGRAVARWGGEVGRWWELAGPVEVPQGRHVLHLALVSEDGAVKGQTSLHLKVAYRSPPLRPQPVAASATASSIGETVPGTGPLPATGTLAPASSLSSGAVSVTATLREWAGPALLRLGGRDRYETAALVSARNFPSADTVVVATGYDFADALAASGLAGSHGAPVLLVRPDAVPNATSREIVRLGASKVVIVGGQAAVSEGVKAELGGIVSVVERIGGRDRYATAALITDELASREGPRPLAFVARGDAFPDALSAAPMAYSNRLPILLVRPTSLPPATESALARHRFPEAVVLGSGEAVSAEVARAVARRCTVGRVGGRDRYETGSLLVLFGLERGLCGLQLSGVATGRDFPDALCGGAAAGSQGGSLLLTPPDQLDANTARTVSRANDLREVQLLGSVKAISDDVMDEIRALIR